MSTFGDTRRDLPRKIGLSATVGIPKLRAAATASGDQKRKSVRAVSSRPSKNKLGETEILVVGGGSVGTERLCAKILECELPAGGFAGRWCRFGPGRRIIARN